MNENTTTTEDARAFFDAQREAKAATNLAGCAFVILVALLAFTSGVIVGTLL